jgi:hypothetical protein
VGMRGSKRVGIFTARRPQYRRLMRTAMGAAHTDSAFLTRNSCGESVISARRPKEKDAVANLEEFSGGGLGA